MIAARPIAGVAFRGVAPGAMIIPVRVSERIDVDGAPWARAISATWRPGSVRPSQPAQAGRDQPVDLDDRRQPGVRAAVEQALEADIVVVAAVGNHHERGDPTPYPASYDGVLGVGAIGPEGCA